MPSPCPRNVKCPQGRPIASAENQRSNWGDGSPLKDPTRGADVTARMGGREEREALSTVQPQHRRRVPSHGPGKTAEGTLGAKAVVGGIKGVGREEKGEKRAGPGTTGGKGLRA